VFCGDTSFITQSRKLWVVLTPLFRKNKKMKLLLCCVLSLTLVLVGCLFPVYANSGGGPVPYTGSNGCSCDEYSTDNVCMKWHCAYSASPESSCFPADSMVTLESGKSIPVSQLREGDRVETVFSDGTIGFDTFYTWLDVDRSKTATFLRLHLSEQDGSPFICCGGGCGGGGGVRVRVVLMVC